LLGIKCLATRANGRDFSINDISILVADADVDLVGLAFRQKFLTQVASPLIAW
jgi:hypothetical protein